MDDAGKQPGGLARAAARGAAITTAGQLARIAVQTLGIVILARLLGPADYGLVAMVGVLIALGEVFREFGLGAAAIQAPSLSVAQRDNLFWANTFLGVLLFVLVLLLASPLALLFSEPDVAGLARALAPVLIINGLATQYRAYLSRSMRFAALTGSEVLAQVVGLVVGVSAALAGWGYWSLAAMQLTQSAGSLLLLAVWSGWLPGWIDRTAPMRDLLRYGGGLVGAQLVSYAASNADSAVIGVRLGGRELGFYDRAYRLIMYPLAQVRAPITTVALPTLSRLSGAPDRYDRALLAGQVGLGYTLIPALAFVAGAHEPLVGVVLGPGWGETGPVLGLLALAGGLQLMAYVGYWVYLSRALTPQLFQYSIISAGVRIGWILIGSSWGVVGVAVGLVAASAMLWPISLWWLSRRTALPLRQLVIGALRILAVAAVAGLASLGTVELAPIGHPALSLVAAGGAVLLTYLVASAVPAVRADERLLLTMVSLVRSGEIRSVRGSG